MKVEKKFLPSKKKKKKFEFISSLKIFLSIFRYSSLRYLRKGNARFGAFLSASMSQMNFFVHLFDFFSFLSPSFHSLSLSLSLSLLITLNLARRWNKRKIIIFEFLNFLFLFFFIVKFWKAVKLWKNSLLLFFPNLFKEKINIFFFCFSSRLNCAKLCPFVGKGFWRYRFSLYGSPPFTTNLLASRIKNLLNVQMYNFDTCNIKSNFLALNHNQIFHRLEKGEKSREKLTVGVSLLLKTLSPPPPSPISTTLLHVSPFNFLSLFKKQYYSFRSLILVAVNSSNFSFFFHEKLEK